MNGGGAVGCCLWIASNSIFVFIYVYYSLDDVIILLMAESDSPQKFRL